MNYDTDYIAVTGSHLYGVATENSDLDLRGFKFDRESVLSLKSTNKYWEQKEVKDEDTVIYNLQHYLNLLIKGNLQSLEALYANEFKYSDLGEKIRLNRDLFLSQKYYRSIKGFAFAEFKRTKCLKEVIKEEGPSTLEKCLNSITSCFNLKRHERREVISLLEDLSGQTIVEFVSNIEQVGKARKELIHKHGYDVKAGYHVIRLLSQGIEILQDHTITFPRPEAEALKQIRSGQMTLEEFDEHHDFLLGQLDQAFEKTTLNKNPNINEINKLWMDLI